MQSLFAALLHDFAYCIWIMPIGNTIHNDVPNGELTFFCLTTSFKVYIQGQTKKFILNLTILLC